MKYTGLFLVVIGVLALIVLHFIHVTFINALLVPPLLIIIIGVMLHVWLLKRESRY